MEYLGESETCARWWNAGCPNPPSTSDLGLPHKCLGYGVNKVVFEQLRVSCVDWRNKKWENVFVDETFCYVSEIIQIKIYRFIFHTNRRSSLSAVQQQP